MSLDLVVSVCGYSPTEIAELLEVELGPADGDRITGTIGHSSFSAMAGPSTYGWNAARDLYDIEVDARAFIRIDKTDSNAALNLVCGRLPRLDPTASSGFATFLGEPLVLWGTGQVTINSESDSAARCLEPYRTALRAAHVSLDPFASFHSWGELQPGSDVKLRTYLETLPWRSTRLDWAQIPHVDVRIVPLDNDAYRRTPLAGYQEALLLRRQAVGPTIIKLPEHLAELDRLCRSSPGPNFLCALALSGPGNRTA